VALLASLCDAERVIGALVLALSLAVKAPPPPSRFLAVDAQRHSVKITLIASYNDANGGFNFDGYSRYLMWTVPRGWTVHVVCENRGPLRHSCAVVRAGSTKPAFRGAATPLPLRGLDPGQTARFTFRAGTTGVYRFACLVPGHETARMWDVFKVTRGGKPAVTDLQAR
jgi:sulfocyanin SoxE-like protein